MSPLWYGSGVRNSSATQLKLDGVKLSKMGGPNTTALIEVGPALHSVLMRKKEGIDLEGPSGIALENHSQQPLLTGRSPSQFFHLAAQLSRKSNPAWVALPQSLACTNSQMSWAAPTIEENGKARLLETSE